MTSPSEVALISSTDSHLMRAGTSRGIAAAALGICLTGALATGCSVIQKAKTVASDVKGNRATMSAFTTKIKSGEAATFEATYATTGSSPATVVYAVQPPKGIAFTDTPASAASGSPRLDLIANASGEYSCQPPGTGSTVDSCQMLAPIAAAAQNSLFDFYTPAHWVQFLQGFSLAAGFAGDKVTKSTMTVNGFAMDCVDFQAVGDSGASTICTTSQGILGYVKVADDPTSFEITAFTTSPAASLFQLPPGAKVTTVTIPSSSPS